MRAQPHQDERGGVRLAIDQHKVGFYVAVAVVRPIPGEGVIEIAPRQRDIGGELVDRGGQRPVERLAVPTRFLALVVATESAGALNRTQSARRAALRPS